MASSGVELCPDGVTAAGTITICGPACCGDTITAKAREKDCEQSTRAQRRHSGEFSCGPVKEKDLPAQTSVERITAKNQEHRG